MPILIRLGAIAVLCCLGAAPGYGQGPPDHQLMLSGTVSKVIDGDTLQVLIGRKHVRVHLNGIDAPEPGQPWAKESSAALAQMVLKQTVDLEPVEPNRGGYMTAVVFIGEAEVGAALVGDGNAWADRHDLRPSDTGLCEVEASAREAKRGLWALPETQRIAPWEYRRRFLHPHHTDYTTETVEHCKDSARKQ